MNLIPQEKYPFPTQAVALMVDLFHKGRVTKEEVTIMNELIVRYLDMRVQYLPKDEQ